MLPLRKRSRIAEVSEALHEAASYTHTLRDRKVRSRIRAAIDHGALVTSRLRRDLSDGHVTRLANDRKLHRNVRALLADVKSAKRRIERKRRHRVRTVLLLIGGSGAAVAAIPSSRHWFSDKLGLQDDAAAPAAGAY
jgi:hypothetical protein